MKKIPTKLRDAFREQSRRVTYQDIADATGYSRVYVVKIMRGDKSFEPAVARVAEACEELMRRQG